MLQSPIFKHDETENFIIDENLSKIYPELSRENLSKWLVTPPNTTYLRVNTVKISRKELIEKIKEISEDLIEPQELLSDVIVIKKAEQNCEIEMDKNLQSIVVGSGCAAAVLRGAQIYAPGILGAPSNLKSGDSVNVFTDLTNKLLKGSIKYDITNFVFIGQGFMTISRNELFKEGIQSGLAVTMTSTSSQCPRLNDDKLKSLKDLYFMQNLPSILTVHQLEIAPNDKCLDMCAAPGGKTCHMASFVNGQILAFDKSKPKIQQIEDNARRLGVLDKINAQVQDATKANLEKESFDKILLDAPCSALGQRPMLIQESKVKELKSFAKLQRKLFEKAMEFLKPNGIIVYSTCSITLEENEEIVKWVLEKFSENIEICSTFPKIGHPGFGLEINSDKVQRFGPEGAESDSTIGFFIAKFKKTIKN